MKLKEIIPSLVEELKLKRLSCEDLLSQKDQVDIIVSLTSIPSRLDKLHIVIRSLLNQQVLPTKIVLWLNYDDKAHIPPDLHKATSVTCNGEPIFEIHYSHLYCPHRKLVHCLERFPEKTIITCDDDCIYDPGMLKALYSEHLKHPHDIIANHCRYISYDASGITLPYCQWTTEVRPGDACFSIMPTGYGGVLYPSGVFHGDVTNEQLYMSLAPNADDLWFKAMSFLNSTKSRCVSAVPSKPKTIIGSQIFALKNTNVRGDKNRDQWDRLRQHYQFVTPNPQLDSINIASA